MVKTIVAIVLAGSALVAGVAAPASAARFNNVVVSDARFK